MNQLDARLRDLLEPLRNHGVGELLQALAEAIDRGSEVEVEPVRRGPRGEVQRSGALGLPERGDLAVTRGGRRLVRRVEGTGLASFEPVTLVSEGGFTTVLSPFRWEAAELRIEARQARPDWRALRFWFLDWVQPRRSDVAPDLEGCVHRLAGPFGDESCWRFEVDFGSAPVAAVPPLIAAVGESGALRLRIGQAP